MRRILALAVALVALIVAGFLWTRDRPVASAAEQLAVSDADPDGMPAEAGPLPSAPAAEVSPATRAARRLARYDRDDDGAVSRDEFLANRRKAFARADRNGDGRLDFEEYAATTAQRFAAADRDADRRLTASEFAATAPKRRPAGTRNCPPVPDEQPS